MNDLQVFNNPDFGEIRTITINNEPWFVGIDVAGILGYAEPKNAVRKFVDEEDKLKDQIDSSGQRREMILINESGVYSLIFRSKMPNAKQFKRWVTSEVLPSIRKTGGYSFQNAQLPTTPSEQIKLLAQGHVELEKKVDGIEQEVQSIKNDLPILPIEADRITTAVRKRGVDVMGGKNAPAYKDRSVRQKVYNSIYASLKYNFGVKSYKSIKRCQTDTAIEIVEKYEPPFILGEQIKTVNTETI